MKTSADFDSLGGSLFVEKQKSSTMTGTRGSQRAPSRTPPFVLVGLVLVLSFLGFSYWSLSSSNSALSSQLEAVNVEKRDVESKHNDLKKTLEVTKAQVISFQLQANELKENVEARESEINTLKADLSQKQADTDKQNSLIDQCDEKLSVVQKDLEAANAEKSNLQLTLDGEREKTHVCTMELCQSPVHQVLEISAGLVGSDQMRQALTGAQLDAAKLMEGINIPAPVVKQSEQPQEPEKDKEQQQPEPVEKLKDGEVAKDSAAPDSKLNPDKENQTADDKAQQPAQAESDQGGKSKVYTHEGLQSPLGNETRAHTKNSSWADQEHRGGLPSRVEMKDGDRADNLDKPPSDADDEDKEEDDGDKGDKTAYEDAGEESFRGEVNKASIDEDSHHVQADDQKEKTVTEGPNEQRPDGEGRSQPSSDGHETKGEDAVSGGKLADLNAIIMKEEARRKDLLFERETKDNDVGNMQRSNEVAYKLGADQMDYGRADGKTEEKLA